MRKRRKRKKNPEGFKKMRTKNSDMKSKPRSRIYTRKSPRGINKKKRKYVEVKRRSKKIIE